MDRDELVNRLHRVLESDDRVRAAWLSGSIGRGQADEYSDVDVWAVVDPARIEAFAHDWPALVERVSPLVLEQFFGTGRRGIVFNHVTPEWLRFDLALVEPDAVQERAADQLRLLFDRDGLSASLQPSTPPRVASSERVEDLVREVLRVLGLLPVVIGREEYVVAASGAGLLQGLLIQLMLEESAGAGRGGALHLRDALPAERYAALESLPPLTSTRDGAIAAQLATAQVFLPLAKELAAATGATWPEDMEAALRAHLGRTLGIAID